MTSRSTLKDSSKIEEELNELKHPILPSKFYASHASSLFKYKADGLRHGLAIKVEQS